jgi:NTE family protein
LAIWQTLRAGPAPLGLALQGGGAHGAFTWGVLDALLEHSAHPLDAASGSSAGAMNAVVLAHGLAVGGRDGAREALSRFWLGTADALPLQELGLVDPVTHGLSASGHWWMQWSHWLAPAQVNPLSIDPLRELLRTLVDFERLRATTRPRLYIAATQANTGRLRVFLNHELSLDAVLASACLPTLHAPVMIDGQPYWDGAYSANPPITPLVCTDSTRDILLVTLSPRDFGPTPATAAEIRARSTELAFNAAFLQEMRTLAQARALAAKSLWPGQLERRLRGLRLHLIDAHDSLAHLPPSSRLLAWRPLLERLRDAGRAQALDWLARHGADVGHRASSELAQWSRA